MIGQNRIFEFHITDACNLKCIGCAHYCDVGPQKNANYESMALSLIAWSNRVQPRFIKIEGGEPFLNQEMKKYISLIAEIWPSRRRLVHTNGTLLKNNRELIPHFLKSNTELRVSFHSSTDSNYIRKWRALSEEVTYWRERGVFISAADSSKDWSKLYKHYGKKMRPFNDQDIAQSFSNCLCPESVILHEGRLWKCPPLAYLKPTLKHLELMECEEWQPYIKYTGLSIDCSEDELSAFFASGAELVCGMCPANPVSEPKIKFDKKKIKASLRDYAEI